MRKQQKEQELFVAHSRHVQTIKRKDLTEVGVHFHVLPRKGGVTSTLRFRRLASPDAPAVLQTTQAQQLHALANLWGGGTSKTQWEQSGTWPTEAVTRIVPAAAQEHQQEKQHNLISRSDQKRLRFVLDLPLPVLLDITPMRCRSSGCKAESTHFTVTWKDIQDRFPGLLRWQGRKLGEIVFTKKLFLYLVQSFYEKLNMRSVRRGLVEYYANNIIALNVASPPAELLRSIPQSGTLAALLVSGMERFLAETWPRLHG